mmetsp:Transcript_19070/g.28839  ORF Transcript_19070/g.28839 Transcript_19070/m.28839 type:complete len:316 (+) Transcript_19070:55-1002(+)
MVLFSPVQTKPKWLKKPDGFEAPKPQPLTVTRKSQYPTLLSGSVGLILRLATGTFVLGWRPAFLKFGDFNVIGKTLDEDKYALRLGPFAFRDECSVPLKEPKKPLILYEYEASPYCRKVREAACLLDLPVEMRPCPGARSGFSDELFDRGGKRTVPYLIDPNTNTEMYESDDIINYMLTTYTDPETYDSKALWPLRGGFALWTSAFAALARGFPASGLAKNARPENFSSIIKPLILYGYETSPFVKPVREYLCALALPHIVIPCARGSRHRDQLFQQTGTFQVPFLRDPNTGVELFESNEIVEYLETVYTTTSSS